jgi:site-specific DNA recombinase
MGRLVLNVLLSFAQFERKIISERTRDKIAAARRKGKWSGGMPILGHDVDPRGGRLLVNDEEAARVRVIFQLYLEHQASLPVVQELDRRGWVGKRWQTCQGHERGGQPFTHTSLLRLLTNVVYVGKLRYQNEVHPGEYAAIVDKQVLQQVQTLRRQNGSTGGGAVRNEFGTILKGLLRCVPRNCAMTPSHSTRKQSKRYRYYVCSSAAKRGRDTCSSPSIAVTGARGDVFVDPVLRIRGGLVLAERGSGGERDQDVNQKERTVGCAAHWRLLGSRFQDNGNGLRR